MVRLKDWMDGSVRDLPVEHGGPLLGSSPSKRVSIEGIHAGKYTPYLSPIYRKNAAGNWMCMTFDVEWYQDGTANITSKITESGKKDRKYKSPVKNVKSKTYIQCAYEQVESKWNKKQGRDGWTQAKQEPILKAPMLLHRWDKEKNKVGPWLVSPKMDGVRATFYTSVCQLVSRKRMPFMMLQIESELRMLNVDMDGELWVEGHTFEEICGAVKRDAATDLTDAIHFNVFDRTDMDAPYVDRLASLYDLKLPPNGHIHVVNCVLCRTEDEVMNTFRKYREMGYEGAVARTLNYKWQWDIRSHDILKIKEVSSKEFKIVEIVYDEDSQFEKLAAFICETEYGQEFKVTPALSKKERARIWFSEPSGKYLNKMYRVDYRDTTNTGLPKHAVGIGLRESGE